MPIENLAKSIKSQLSGTKLTLGRDLKEVTGWRLLWDSAVFASRLALEPASIKQTESQLTVKGKGNFLGASDTDVTFVFEEDSQGISVSLDVLFNPSIGLSIAGGAFAADGVGFSIFVPSSGKSISGDIHCTLKSGPLRFPLSVYLPSDPRGWIIRSSFTKVALPNPGELVALTGQNDLFSALPASIDSLDAALYISDLMIKCNDQQKTVDQICVRFGSDKDWPIIPGSLVVRRPSILFSVIHPFDAAGRMISAIIDGTIVAGKTKLPIQLCELGAMDWVVRVPTDYFPLPSLGELKVLCGDPQLFDLIPEGVANLKGIVLTGFELRFDEAAKTISHLSLGFLLEDTWPLLGFDKVSVRNISINLVRDAGPNKQHVVSGSVEGTLTLWDNPVSISAILMETLTFTGKILKVNFSQVIEEFLNAVSLPSDLPDVTFSDVDLTLIPEMGGFSFSGQSTDVWAIPLGIGQLTVTGASLQMDRTSSGANKKQAETKCRIHGQGTLGLNVEGFSANFTGSVDFEASHARVGFTFKTTNSQGSKGNTLTLGIPTGVPKIKPQAIFTFDKFAIDHTADGWQVQADATTQFKGLPSFMTAPIPGTKLSLVPQKPRTWTLKAGRGAVEFSTDRLWDDPFPPTPFPTIQFNGKNVSLGVFWLDVREWTIGFGKGSSTGSKVSLQATLEMAVSEKINRVFGVGTNGRPWLKFFKTFKQGQKNPLPAATGLQLNLSEKGITARLQGSPINAMQPDAEGLYHIALGPNGQFGEFTTRLPEFSYNGVGWSAAGEFHIEKALKLPLTPIKSALTRAGLGLVAKVLPDAVPLDHIDLVDKNNKLTLGQWLAKLQQGAPSLRIPQEVTKALKDLVAMIDNVLEQTPGRLNEYLNFDMPEDLRFNIEVGGTGGIKLDVDTRTQNNPDPKPIKLLLPFMGPPPGLPELLGIQLTSLSFGQLMGSLFLLQLDGKFDRFDLLALVGCLSTGGYLADGKTSCKAFHHSYTIDQLLAVIPAGSPVPVPLFYKELAVSYYGWEMLKYESCWSFPEPDGGLFSLIALFSELRPFFTKPNYKLKPNTPPKGYKLPFTIGPNYIQLPPYLGGGLLGKKTRLPKWSVWESLANLLNGLKTGAPQDFVSALPIEARIAEVDVTFGPFSSKMGFAVTTPREFKTAIMQGNVRTKAGQDFGKRLRALGTGPDKQIAALLPKPGPGAVNADGLIILLLGTFEIKNIVILQGAFGLAAVGSKENGKGFGTGVQITGVFGNALKIAIQGAITITGKELRISGDSGIWWKNTRMTGLNLVTTVDKTGFSTQLTFDVTPKCTITGKWTITKTKMAIGAIGGQIKWDYGAKGPFTADGTIAFSRQELTLSTTDVKGAVLHGIKVKTLAATLPAVAAKPLTATVELEIPETFNTALRGEIQAAAKQAQDELTKVSQLAINELNALKGHELSISGVKAMLAAICHTIADKINTRVNKLPTKKWYGKGIFGKYVNVRNETRKEVASYLKKLYSFARRFGKSTKATLANDVTALVNWALKNKTHTVYRTAANIRITTITIMGPQTINHLSNINKNVPHWIARLPEKDTGLRFNGKMVQYGKGSVNAILSDIAASIGKVAKNVPSITGILVNTDLTGISVSEVKVYIKVMRGAKSKSYPFSFDFKNPASGTPDLWKLILKDLGTSL